MGPGSHRGQAWAQAIAKQHPAFAHHREQHMAHATITLAHCCRLSSMGPAPHLAVPTPYFTFWRQQAIKHCRHQDSSGQHDQQITKVFQGCTGAL